MAAMTQPEGWRGVAFNQATESENRIHADDVAKQYGFRGGLVPGVTVFAYLVQPAVEAWGLDWLERGTASVTLDEPLYDGVDFEVTLEELDASPAYLAAVVDAGGVRCAQGRVALPSPTAETRAPRRRGDPPAPPRDERPEATRAALERLREEALGHVVVEWPGKSELDRYTRDLDAMPDLVRLDRGGYANAAFVLGIANWVLARNVVLGPWIHVESDVRNFGAIARGSRLCAEASVTDLFERRGHEFVDLDVAVYDDGDDTPLMRASHRAIYRLRPAA